MTLSHEIRVGDCLDALRAMPDQSFHCCITSPPYFGLRDYGMASQIGLEQTPDEFVSRLVEVFREVRRVLRDDGTLWLNLGDSYANDGKWGGSSGGKHANALHGNTSVGRTKTRTGLKPKDLIGIPWRVAFALQVDGWFLRQDIIWHKPNPMPESVRDRCTKAHEYVFMLTKSPRYYYDHEAVKEDAVSEHPSGNGFKRDARESYKNLDGTARGNDEQWTGVGGKRNRRSVWTVPTAGFKGAHFATFPPDLIRPCVLAGAPRGGLVLDPFGGAGTTALVAMQEGRRSVLIELNPEYAAIARNRLDTAWLEGAAQLDLLHDQKESVA
ncbi:site-specific DNA-methyltransferase [Pseudomonas aeruginosa]|nr:site-specific DNA-methyltransferase [Pseudomonas aeruginosa]ELC3006454.1 site-specific DNA-methyltransferase [Pseudomonas aeruginosa]ELF6909143.1 site-specific DNA-methyltransferase [Pseudomonas aeruginosa]KSP13097.1 site-specific DNA-methyltransferase [Pseudomonas aeruginosa]PTZ99572.1 site-specific DNA-methyltransferase [Pseudomonas aeruginosa]